MKDLLHPPDTGHPHIPLSMKNENIEREKLNSLNWRA
jgi:hypothetical protein